MIKVRMVKTYEKVVELEVESLDSVGSDTSPWTEIDWKDVPLDYVDTIFILGEDYGKMKEGDML